jgi:two-component sensor histidine kinase
MRGQGERKVKKHAIFAPVLRIVVPYMALGAAWILFSDRLLISAINDPRRLMALSTAKGWFYVLVTSVLLFSLVFRELHSRSVLETQLSESVAEKGALLAELNHRVKNNLQILTSILNLEAEDIVGEEARELNDRTRARIRSIGLAHERLFESGDFARIDLGAYLRSLWDIVIDIFAIHGAIVSFNLAKVRAGATEAVPFGLYAAEALTNAIRYGIDPDGKIDVAISLGKGADGRLELMIRDKGLGLPEGAAGLGLRLMDALAAQLRGTLERYNDEGAVVCLRFPYPALEGIDA